MVYELEVSGKVLQGSTELGMGLSGVCSFLIWYY